MKTQSFLFDRETVFTSCLKALKKNDFHVIGANQDEGTIKAITGNGVITSRIEIEVQVDRSKDNTAMVNISSKMIRKGFFGKSTEDNVKEEFVNTLYKYVTAGTQYFAEYNSNLLLRQSTRARRINRSSISIKEPIWS